MSRSAAGRLFRFFGLPWADRVLLLQATLLLTGIRLALMLFPFSAVRHRLSRLGSRVTHAHQSADALPDAKRVIWAVEAAGRRFPVIGTCLLQALAAHVLLGRRGCPSDLCIGVKRDSGGAFAAHAWLESNGVVLIGAAARRSYVPMPALNGLERP